MARARILAFLAIATVAGCYPVVPFTVVPGGTVQNFIGCLPKCEPPGPMNVYGGVELDLKAIKYLSQEGIANVVKDEHCPIIFKPLGVGMSVVFIAAVAVVDTPVSVILDTLTLPITVPVALLRSAHLISPATSFKQQPAGSISETANSKQRQEE
jgi:uncharacterized protein YceK